VVWAHDPVAGPVEAQCSAHGTPHPATVTGTTVTFDEPQRRLAPGQSVVLYRGELVVGGGIAQR
ncbi:MAG TPA: aminomethyltransferase beta-barrel domain-containing protein, partial [Acidimicrobiales bacterium]